ncbi:hypothetical protein D3C86_2155780 [compost metagenome]
MPEPCPNNWPLPLSSSCCHLPSARYKTRTVPGMGMAAEKSNVQLKVRVAGVTSRLTLMRLPRIRTAGV